MFLWCVPLFIYAWAPVSPYEWNWWWSIGRHEEKLSLTTSQLKIQPCLPLPSNSIFLFCSRCFLWFLILFTQSSYLRNLWYDTGDCDDIKLPRATWSVLKKLQLTTYLCKYSLYKYVICISFALNTKSHPEMPTYLRFFFFSTFLGQAKIPQIWSSISEEWHIWHWYTSVMCFSRIWKCCPLF